MKATNKAALNNGLVVVMPVRDPFPPHCFGLESDWHFYVPFTYNYSLFERAEQWAIIATNFERIRDIRGVAIA